MSRLSEQANKSRGDIGYYLGSFLAILFGSILTQLVAPIGLAFLLLWALPSLIHARVSIARQSQYLPLPWEDQFAAVVVGFILQIPLWLTSGFVGFLLALILLSGNPSPTTGGWPLEVGAAFLAWMVATFGIYLVLYIATLAWSVHGVYHDDPASKCISIRDAKPIYHPF